MTGPKKILVVGGGSSGWMAAALLAKKLPSVDIELVEASDVPTIGVGESTNGTMTYFMSEVGIDEKSFMRACDATFKLAIRFENFGWTGNIFFHPLGGRRVPLSTSDDPDSIRHRVRMFSPNADREYTETEAVVGSGFSRDYFYSYQLDAGLLGQYMKQLCKGMPNIRHTIATVEAADLTPSGAIESIRTDDGQTLTADLYIDCTGFRSLLLSRTLREPFESYSSLLLNDRAIATRVPYLDKERELANYTNCTALSSGWAWNIPLWSRMGTGYVYSSKYLSAEQAEDEFRAFLGAERVRNLQFNHLDIRVGRHRRAWVENCVSIGISYGFLEPLESTGLSLTQISIYQLLNALTSGLSIGLERAVYNQRCQELFDSTRDFILAHYVLTSREDTPYWRHVRHNINVPESLISVLCDARDHSYASLKGRQHLYREASWNMILSGMGFFGRKTNEATASVVTPRTSELTNHAAFLQHEIFDGEYEDSASQAASPVDRFAHPTWYPIW